MVDVASMFLLERVGVGEFYLEVENTQCGKRDDASDNQFSQIVIVENVRVIHPQVRRFHGHNVADHNLSEVGGLVQTEKYKNSLNHKS